MILNAQDIAESLDIVQVIQDYVSLKKKGVNYSGICPFHGDKNPSMSVHQAKGIYKCFACGAGGGAVKFVMEIDKLSYPEALKKLAARYKIEVKEDTRPRTDEEQAEHAKKEAAFIALDTLQAHFGATEKAEVLTYWKGRAFSEETLETFGIGYCDGTKPPHVDLSDTGTINAKENLIYYKRTTIPIHNRHGRVVAFGARQVFAEGETKPTKGKKGTQAEGTDNSLPMGEGGGGVKWLNGAESPIYNKAKTLFNLHRADKHIRIAKAVYIVEGYADVMAMWQLGMKNVVGLCGTALTPEHVAILKKYNGDQPLKIIIAIDNEVRGENRKPAIWKAFEHMLESLLPFADVRLLHYGAVKDMGAFLETGARIKQLREDDALGIWVEEEVGDKEAQNAKTQSDWVNLQERFAKLVSHIGKTPVRDMYVRDYATKLNTSIKPLADMVKSIGKVDESTNRTYEYKHIQVKDEILERQPLYSVKVQSGALEQAPMIYVSRQRAVVKEQFGADYVRGLPRFANFTNVPSHHNYQRVITYTADGTEYKYFNRYDPLPFKPVKFDLPANLDEVDYTTIPEIRHTAQIFRHIADPDINGPQFERILWDWVALTYLKPTQRIRALALVSTEEGSGKSTFIKMLKRLYGSNAVMTDANRIAGNFNALFSGKLLGMIEETKDSRGDIENKLKDWITSEEMTVERKGVDAVEEETFTKFIMASNHEHNFMKVGTSTTRFIVLKVPLPKNKSEDFEEKVYAEVPYLMYFLEKRGILSKKADRLWFAQEDCENDALRKLREGSKDLIQQNIEQLIQDLFTRTSYNQPILYLTSSQIQELLVLTAGQSYKDRTPTSIQSFLTNTMKLKYHDSRWYPGIHLIDTHVRDWRNLEWWPYDDKKLKGRPVEFPIWRFCQPEHIRDLYEEKARVELLTYINEHGDRLQADYPEFQAAAWIKAAETKPQVVDAVPY